MKPNFDRIGRVYRWLEYASLGTALTRCRNHFLTQLTGCKQALILGDGDGRFSARLLAANPAIQVEAVDLSGRMLELLRRRSAFAGSRLTTHLADARSFIATHAPDLIVTHFLLDCLTQAEVDCLIDRLAGQLVPGGLWVVSEFRIPNGPLHWAARAYIRTLYLAFRVLTGLRVNRLPDYATPLRNAGLVPIAIHHSLLGLLTTELWGKWPLKEVPTRKKESLSG